MRLHYRQVMQSKWSQPSKSTGGSSSSALSAAPKKMKRVITPLEDNVTSSLFPDLQTKKITKENTKEELLQKFREEITNHSFMRIWLFFNLLVVYYDKKLEVKRDRTTRQHGIGGSKCAT